MEEDLKLATYEQITTMMSHLITNSTNMAVTYYTMFYDTNPTDVVLKIFDDNGQLKTFTVPNRAKDASDKIYKTEDYYIYKNPYALPLGFGMKNKVKNL